MAVYQGTPPAFPEAAAFNVPAGVYRVSVAGGAPGASAQWQENAGGVSLAWADTGAGIPPRLHNGVDTMLALSGLVRARSVAALGGAGEQSQLTVTGPVEGWTAQSGVGSFQVAGSGATAIYRAAVHCAAGVTNGVSVAVPGGGSFVLRPSMPPVPVPISSAAVVTELSGSFLQLVRSTRPLERARVVEVPAGGSLAVSSDKGHLDVTTFSDALSWFPGQVAIDNQSAFALPSTQRVRVYGRRFVFTAPASVVTPSGSSITGGALYLVLE